MKLLLCRGKKTSAIYEESYFNVTDKCLAVSKGMADFLGKPSWLNYFQHMLIFEQNLVSRRDIKAF